MKGTKLWLLPNQYVESRENGNGGCAITPERCISLIIFVLNLCLHHNHFHQHRLPLQFISGASVKLTLIDAGDGFSTAFVRLRSLECLLRILNAVPLPKLWPDIQLRWFSYEGWRTFNHLSVTLIPNVFFFYVLKLIQIVIV